MFRDFRDFVFIVLELLAWLACIAVAIVAAEAFAAPPLPRDDIGGFPSLRKVELGRKLFFDSRLSADNSTSCATCHDPRFGFEDGRTVALGLRNQLGTRSTPTVLASASHELQFWDMRTDSLEQQALQPLTNPIEMGNQSNNSPAIVAARLNRIDGYRQLFAAIYRDRPITPRQIADAISSYEKTLYTRDMPVERFLAGDVTALSAEAQRGLVIFQASSCMECHPPPWWTDNQVHNCGVTHAFDTGDEGRSGVLTNQDTRPEDIRAFKTPTLMSIEKRAPYFHAGSARTLEEVVRYFNSGGVRWRDRTVDARKDARIRPLGLSAAQERELAAFLREGFAGQATDRQPRLPR